MNGSDDAKLKNVVKKKVKH